MFYVPIDQKQIKKAGNMILSEEEVLTILKKSLPKTNYKDLEDVARSIAGKAEHWQEVDLDEHIHDEVETKTLHDICQRKSNNSNPPKKIRLFFKE